MASLGNHIDQNIDDIVTLPRREWAEAGVSQRRLERVSRFIGRPAYLVGVLGFGCAWIVVNTAAPAIRWRAFDPVPYAIPDGLMTLFALLTTTVVLIAQNRLTELEQQHSQ